MSIKDENTQGQLEEQISMRAFEIGEQGRDLEDWATCHANAPHPGVPTKDEDDYLSSNLIDVLHY